MRTSSVGREAVVDLGHRQLGARVVDAGLLRRRPAAERTTSMKVV